MQRPPPYGTGLPGYPQMYPGAMPFPQIGSMVPGQPGMYPTMQMPPGMVNPAMGMYPMGFPMAMGPMGMAMPGMPGVPMMPGMYGMPAPLPMGGVPANHGFVPSVAHAAGASPSVASNETAAEIVTPSPKIAPDFEKFTTVFVGGIPAGIEDKAIEGLLARCGKVKNWKRVFDQSGSPKGT